MAKGWIWTLLLAPAAIAIQVGRLPGQNFDINFKHYSGYLDGSPTHKLHYWLTESQGDPAKDPFLVWMNGGPGCSSLDGLLSELGPFHIKDDAETLYLNPHSWNRNANVLFLEAPAGVGFSYATDGNIKTDDDQVARENYAALKDFFTKFPQFRSNDLYITGESYGGIYVPTLVARIIDGQATFRMNLKGMAVGNGMLSNDLNTNSIMNFAWAHGLVDQKLWELLETACCRGCGDNCDFSKASTPFCQSQVNNVTMMVWGMGLNVYDLYRSCYRPEATALRNDRFQTDVRHISHAKVDARFVPPLHLIDITEITVEDLEDPPCLNNTAVILYLNQPAVRATLGIPDSVGTWTVCSQDVSAVYKRVYTDQFANVRKALNANLRVLIYNGDTDMACNFLMGQEFCRQLQIPRLRAKRMWKLGTQIAGTVTRYRNLDFVTVKGAGHMVPQWRAPEAFHMITSFLNGRDY